MDDMNDEPANQYYPLMDSNAGAFNGTIWHAATRFLLTGRPLEEVLGYRLQVIWVIPEELRRE